MIYPLLYSFRRCPYAMRARMALVTSGIPCVLREVDLKNKPPELLEISPKGTVPVLVLPDGGLVDESLDIIYYAVGENDPEGWSNVTDKEQDIIDTLVEHNDTAFAPLLTKYKYFERYPEQSQTEYLQQLEEAFLREFEEQLSKQPYMVTDHVTVADIAMFPFIRQFALVDKAWFAEAPYPRLRSWLQGFLDSPVFERVMQKYAPWKAGDVEAQFPVYSHLR